jgi:phage virion morphogenesis protein
MAGTSIRYGFDASPISLHLARLAVLGANQFAEVRRDIGEYFKGDIQDNLDGQKLFDGKPMEQSEAAIGRAGKTLIKNGHLRDNYNYQLEGTGVAIGNPLVYAAIHHFGGETGRKGHRFTLPARPVMGMGERQERRIGDMLIAELRALQ